MAEFVAVSLKTSLNLLCPFGGGGITFDQGNQVVGGRLDVRDILLRDGCCIRQLLADLFQA